MSVGSGGLGTVYSRLPQSTSDVESSEDEVSQHENLIFYRKIGTPKKGNVKEEDIGKFENCSYFRFLTNNCPSIYHQFFCVLQANWQ